MAPLLATILLAQETTSTTEVEIRRVVGEHPGSGLVVGASVVLLALILAAGYMVQRRTRQRDRVDA